MSSAFNMTKTAENFLPIISIYFNFLVTWLPLNLLNVKRIYVVCVSYWLIEKGLYLLPSSIALGTLFLFTR